MRPVLTVDEMREVDADALESVSESVLVERAGTAVATWALRLLGGAYGRRVVVVAGKGNNGADGRVAAEQAAPPRGQGGSRRRRPTLPNGSAATAGFDLVIDAAYGTGFKGTLQGSFGAGGRAGARGRHPFWDRRQHGRGVGRGAARGPDRHVRSSQAGPSPRRRAGSLRTGRGRRHRPRPEPGPHLARRGRRRRTARSGARPARRTSGSRASSWSQALRGCSERHRSAPSPLTGRGPGWCVSLSRAKVAANMPASEAVSFEVPRHGWATAVLEVAERCRAVVIGPGIGRDAETRADVRSAWQPVRAVPVVVDADALFALGQGGRSRRRRTLAARRQRAGSCSPRTRVSTRGCSGQPVGRRQDHRDRRGIGCHRVRRVPERIDHRGARDPDGDVRVVMSGGPNLATAGTGDVLSGAIGAFLASGTGPARGGGARARTCTAGRQGSDRRRASSPETSPT